MENLTKNPNLLIANDDKHTFASLPAIRTLKAKLKDSMSSSTDGERFYSKMHLT